MIDTIAASIKLEAELDVRVFQGASAREDFGSGERSVRLFRNPQGTAYEPRLTYWPETRLLRIEFSVRKAAALAPGIERASVETEDVVIPLVDAWLRGLLGPDLPPLTTWTCQRIDYAVDLEVGELLPQYLALLGRCQVGSWSRQPHASGVVWKSASRWVKWYDKTREAERAGPQTSDTGASVGQARAAHVLRFEVSNYRDAVRYMAHRWFGCEQTVQEMVQPGRALYVLARYFEQLGLGAASYDSREYELHQLKAAFGSRSLAGAAHALSCIREHGTQSYKSQALLSKSSYYRWLRALRENGFLASHSHQRLPVLRLPCVETFEKLAKGQNLKFRQTTPELGGLENAPKNPWEKLAEMLQVSVKTPRNSYLLEQFNEWRSNLDRKTGTMPGRSDRTSVFPAGESAAAGAGA